MTTEQTTDQALGEGDLDNIDVAPVGEPDEATRKAANSEVRAYADRTAAENKILREGAISGALVEIGLSATEGLGLAIAESFDGVITPENVAQFAEEKYKHKSENAPVPPAVETGERLETLEAASTPVTPPPDRDEAKEATDKMYDPESGRDDAVASINAKMGQFQAEHY